jgi:catechol 2,3-dioxygenase-like lactoylglutathione lyase family enzyme
MSADLERILAGLPVADVDAAVDWYEQLLGRPVGARPMDGLAEWHFAERGSIQLIEDAERAGRGLLTLSVGDLRRHVGELRSRGLTPGPIDDQTSEKLLFATIADPEGNTITFVEERPPGG